jgi:hypothetical protein
MLFVRMLIIILQRMSRSIQTKEACLPVITATSPVTSDPNVHSSRSRKVQRKLPTRATSGTIPTMALQAPLHQQKFVPGNQSSKPKKNKSRRYKRKPQKHNGGHGYEGLLSLIQDMLRNMANMDMTANHLHGSSWYGSRMMRPFTP